MPSTGTTMMTQVLLPRHDGQQLLDDRRHGHHDAGADDPAEGGACGIRPRGVPTRVGDGGLAHDPTIHLAVDRATAAAIEPRPHPMARAGLEPPARSSAPTRTPRKTAALTRAPKRS